MGYSDVYARKPSGVFHKDSYPLIVTRLEGQNTSIALRDQKTGGESRFDYFKSRNMSTNVCDSENSATDGKGTKSEGGEIHSGLLAGLKVSMSRLLLRRHH